MDPNAFVAYLIAAAVLIATPGPDMLFVVAQGAAGGPRAGVLSALGVGMGVCVHATLAALGIAALLQTAPQVFQAIRYGGALYLIALGIANWRRPRGVADRRPDEGCTDRQILVRGFLSNALNPKVALFFIALLPQFVPPDAVGAGVVMLIYGAVFGVLTLAVYSALGSACGGGAARLLRSTRARRRMDRLAGSIYIGLGLRLALADRP
jgi:threonine/homoserine/homoserine lactone efflux protein